MAAEIIPEHLLTSLKFDRSKPHGLVTPPENGAHFHQDGVYFDQNGNVAPDMVDADALKKLKRVHAMREADKAAKDARRRALEKAGVDPDAPENREPEAEKGDPGDVNLLAWAREEIKLPWFKVAKAFIDQYAYAPSTKEQAVSWLRENGLLEGADED